MEATALARSDLSSFRSLKLTQQRAAIPSQGFLPCVYRIITFFLQTSRMKRDDECADQSIRGTTSQRWTRCPGLRGVDHTLDALFLSTTGTPPPNSLVSTVLSSTVLLAEWSMLNHRPFFSCCVAEDEDSLRLDSRK